MTLRTACTRANRPLRADGLAFARRITNDCDFRFCRERAPRKNQRQPGYLTDHPRGFEIREFWP
jgi:hypothetical protein